MGRIATYTHTSSTIGSDSFTYTVEDEGGQISPEGTITINPLNSVPVIQNPGTILVNQNEFINFTIEVIDADNDSVSITTISDVNNGVIEFTGENNNIFSYKYKPTLGYSGTDSWTIKATDSKGAESAQLAVDIKVEKAYRISVNSGSFGSDIDSICFAPKNNISYISTNDANSVEQVEIGMSIYSNTILTDTIVPPSSTNNLLPISDSSKSVVLTIDSSGKVIKIDDCDPASTSKSIVVKYSVNSIAYCDNDFQYLTVWYSDDIETSSLSSLISDGIELFSSEYASNLYQSTGGTTVIGLIDSGIYSDIDSEVYYKRSTLNTWGENLQGGLEWECGGAEETSVFSMVVDRPHLDGTDINKFCNSDVYETTLWYTRPLGSTPFDSLLDLAKTNTPVYKTALGANTFDPIDLYESNIFSVDSKYLVWENQGDGVNLSWYGYDLTNFVSGSNITKYGTCGAYQIPTITENEIQRDVPNVNDTNVFYGFMSLNPEIELGSQYNNFTKTLYWPIYVIDGLHTVNSGDTGSYIKTFIDELSYGNVIQPELTGECLTYAYKITAEDLDDAVFILNEFLINSQQRPTITDGVGLGLSSESSVLVFESDKTSQCIIGDNDQSINTYTFPIVNGYETINAGPNFNTQSNYNLDNVAKPLLRTNPKLSGNIKIVTTSNDEVYLESISASKELSNIKYKKNSINPDGNYSADVSRFFKGNKTPSDLIYETYRSQSDLSVLDSYDKQIEEIYQYGTSYNYSKNYEEDYRIFAPIWADQNMPNNFVIFKVKNPSNQTQIYNNNTDRISDILKNAEIVKSFDLTKKSALGKYIRNHVQQETFPKSPITVSFGKNETTKFNGIDLKSGEITSKGEYIYKDFVQADKPIIEANDFITDGFRRNDILCANLLNLEFLFDDDNASEYSVNRYFGLYVDDIDSGIGEINSINNNIIKFSEVSSIVDPEKPFTAIPSQKQMTTSPTLGYVKINDVYYKISNSGVYDTEKLEVKVDNTTGEIEKSIGISHTGKSISLTNTNERGFDFVKMSIISNPESADKIAVLDSREESYKFTFIKHVPGETVNINIGDSTGNYVLTFNNGNNFSETKKNIENSWELMSSIKFYLNLEIDENDESFVITEKQTNLGDLNMYVSGTLGTIIRVDQLQTNVNIQKGTYIANYTLPKGTYKGQQYSAQGSLGEVASALAGVIDQNSETLDAYNIGSDIWVKSKVPGYKLLQHVVLVNLQNVIDFVKVENQDINNLLKLRSGENTILSQWRAHYLTGGNSTGKSILVDNNTLSEISVGDYLETNYKNTFNKVIDIVEDITAPNSDKSKIILDKKSSLKNGEARVFNQNIVQIGLFSAYNIYDMNFDFYDKSNSDLKELVHETLKNIDYEPYTNAISNIDGITGEFNTKLAATDIFDDNFALNPEDYFSNLSSILKEESNDDDIADKIESEYDRLKENQLKEFATNSRVVPNINKWVLKDSLTVRDQPYYLNANEAFGRTNFSPDITATSRNKNDMTHEWFYMDKIPKYLRYDQLNSTFSYINYIEDFELTPDLFKSVKNDYFDKFMITEGFEKNLTVDDLYLIKNDIGNYNFIQNIEDDFNNTFFKTELKKKYTLIDGGDTSSFASTIFKGLKVVLKNRKEFINKTALDFVKSSEFNGYKFSILLKTKTDVNTNDIDFEVIQNKKFKFVIFFITVDISDYWIKGNMNRKLLYELNHKILYNHSEGDYEYANTTFDGALNWNQADFTENAPYSIEGIDHFDGSQPNFDNQILLGENGLYGDVLMDIHPNTPGNSIYKFSIASVENSNLIKIQSLPVNVSDPTDVLDITYMPNYIQRQIKYYYVNGGTGIHRSLLEKLSINNVANMINLNDDSVSYTTIEEDGTENKNRFTINFEDGTEIVKYASIGIEEDNDKPKSYKLFKGIIGYNLVNSEEPEYYPFLIRHNGDYTVDFKPVITFTDMYTHFKSNRLQSTTDINESKLESILYRHSLNSVKELETAKSYYERYNRCGTTFNVGFIKDGNIHDNNWGIIKNHFYHKVNEINPEGVTKLSESSDKLPLYPLIDEIAISKKDVNVFKSSWDKDYYTRSFSSGESQDIPGTINNAEEKSYLSSTAMKINDSYDVISFTSQHVNSQEDLDLILKNATNQSEVIIFEDEDQLVADFYISDSVVRLLKNDGVLNRIKGYVNAIDSAGDKTTLVDDAEFYINRNIIKKFVVDSISLYTRKFKGSKSSITDIADVNNPGENGFSPDNNFTFKPHKQKPMNFRLIYNKRLGYSYDIKPMIKIKS